MQSRIASRHSRIVIDVISLHIDNGCAYLSVFVFSLNVLFFCVCVCVCSVSLCTNGMIQTWKYKYDTLYIEYGSVFFNVSTHGSRFNALSVRTKYSANEFPWHFPFYLILKCNINRNITIISEGSSSLPVFFFSRDRVRAKKKHTTIIIELFELHLHIYITEEKDNWYIGISLTTSKEIFWAQLTLKPLLEFNPQRNISRVLLKSH